MKLFIVIAMAITFSGCSLFYDAWDWGPDLGIKAKTVEEACTATMKLLKYQVQKEWVKPYQSVARGYGDCKDYATVAAKICRENGISGVKVHETLIHAFIKKDGKYYEPQSENGKLFPESNFYEGGLSWTYEDTPTEITFYNSYAKPR